jgi:nucleoside-diphosphate-sugar epimerase
MSSSTRSLDAGLPAIAPGTTAAVTGATGFIGGRLVERLAEGGGEVTCLVRGLANARLHRAGARIRSLDLADADAVRAALRGIEVVFHLAYDWGDTAWNVRALRALIEGCRANGCTRLVHASSFVVYEIPSEGELTEDSPATTATGGYAHTKLALETELLRATREQGVPGTTVQPTIVYGPQSQPWTVDPADMLRYGTVVLPGAGEGICNAVYVDDVVSAMILAAQRPEAVGQRYLVSGPPITWRQFYEGMARAAGAEGPEYWPAERIARANARPRLLRLAADPERVVRGIAGKGPVRKLVKVGLRALPGRARHVVQDRLYAPATRRRGFTHVPDPGRLGFLQGRATIHSAKARAELGYAPAFDFDTGMVPTARYLKDTYPKSD